MSLLQIMDANEYDDIFTERGYNSQRQVVTNNNRLSIFYWWNILKLNYNKANIEVV